MSENKKLEDLAGELKVAITSLSEDFKGTGLTDKDIQERIKPQIDRIQELIQNRVIESGDIEALLKTVNSHVMMNSPSSPVRSSAPASMAASKTFSSP